MAERLSRRADVTLTSLVRRAERPFEQAIDFETLADDPVASGERIGVGAVDVGISCLGTTIRAAGSQAAFRRVDQDYVLGVARLARARGARQFVLMTSVGAGNSNFYLRVKGEIEAAVLALGFERVDLIRPGLLLGPRRERRPGEQLGQALAPLLAPLMRGSLRRYAGIEASTVADAIANLVAAPGAGTRVHHNPDLIALALRG